MPQTRTALLLGIAVGLFAVATRTRTDAFSLRPSLTIVHRPSISLLAGTDDDDRAAAAWDAHDCNDPGMEGAAEERAVMLAEEMLHELQQKQDKTNEWNDQHLAHGAANVHEESNQELKASEDAAAWDAHDCNDAGMEAAAEERAVMLANEFMHDMKLKQQQQKKKKDAE